MGEGGDYDLESAISNIQSPSPEKYVTLLHFIKHLSYMRLKHLRK
jgi:hypothetical protein